MGILNIRMIHIEVQISVNKNKVAFTKKLMFLGFVYSFVSWISASFKRGKIGLRKQSL